MEKTRQSLKSVEDRLRAFTTTVDEKRAYWDRMREEQQDLCKPTAAPTKIDLRTRGEGGGKFQCLPLESITHILSYMNSYSIFSLESTCWGMYTLFLDNSIWKPLFIVQFLHTGWCKSLSIVHSPVCGDEDCGEEEQQREGEGGYNYEHTLTLRNTDSHDEIPYRKLYSDHARSHTRMLQLMRSYRDNVAGRTVSNAPACSDYDELSELLTNLTRVTELTPYPHEQAFNETRRVIAKERLIIGLVTLLQSESHLVQHLAGVCLANLVVNDVDNQFNLAIRNAGGVKSFISILCSPDTEIQRLASRSASRALCNMYCPPLAVPVDQHFLDTPDYIKNSWHTDIAHDDEAVDWSMVYFYRNGGLKSRANVNLICHANGKIEGLGHDDDEGAFNVHGHFDIANHAFHLYFEYENIAVSNASRARGEGFGHISHIAYWQPVASIVDGDDTRGSNCDHHHSSITSWGVWEIVTGNQGARFELNHGGTFLLYKPAFNIDHEIEFYLSSYAS